MRDVTDADDDAIWASVSRETLDTMALLAARILKCQTAFLSSYPNGPGCIRGAFGMSKLGLSFTQTAGPRLEREKSDAPYTTGVLPGIGAYLGVRLHLGTRPDFGSVYVIDRHPRGWATEEISLLCQLAACMSARVALEHELNRRKKRSAALVDITHELRTPLQAIVGFTEFLKIEQKPEIIAAHARTIQSAAESLLALVNQTLHIAENEADSAIVEDDASRLSVAAPASVLDIHAFAETCLSMVKPLVATKGISLALDIQATVPQHVVLDAQKVQQALLNLLNNAVKFTDAGDVTLRIACDREILTFSVVDTGIGIASDDHDLLFHRFSRIVDDGRDTAGSGLGLSITRDLVESLAGRIGFYPNEAGGSNFWIELPLVGGDTSSTAADPTMIAALDLSDQPSPTRRAARILLADDLDLNRKLIADMLSLDGHIVDCVADGEAAVAAASACPYDLILMDMIMPVMDGLTATRAVRALPAPRCNVPIVALTANSFREQLDACLAAGMDATLTKPMSIDALTRAVDAWTRDRMKAA